MLQSRTQSTISDTTYDREDSQKPPTIQSAPATIEADPKDEVTSEETIPKPRYPPSTRVFKDDPDNSRHPSYTNFKLPYPVVCRMRYANSIKKYNRQFRRELKTLEDMQPSAYEALRFNRIFSITTLWPPLHTKKEIEYVLRNFYKLPPKQQDRLNYLLKEEQK